MIFVVLVLKAEAVLVIVIDVFVLLNRREL